ncbi:peptidoglycan recognition protein family protein [Streptomyces cinereoruber]|uniref:peptidoglycan recognition protein family protein n=1 Tax=Streptomyces cinereoruber TaxID=67260 RepID=UPI003C2BC635
MAWYPGATRYELQPESDAQPAIRPTQFIVHSIIAPWTAKRTYEYWRDSTNLESHFGLGYEGDLGQFIGTETRADANAAANRRPDGTGAVSIETASNTSGTDPWTSAQVEKLIQLGVWLHRTHGIPLRICRTHDDPGFGYHRLHSQWAVSGTACPGDARVRQFKEVVFPGIVARVNGQTSPPIEEDDVPITDAEIKRIAAAAALATQGYHGKLDGKPDPRDAYAYLRDTETRARRIEERLAKAEQVALTDAQVASLADKVAASPTLANRIAELVADKLAARLAD